MTDDKILTTRSRAIAVLGISESLGDAEKMAEKATECIKGPLRHRRDIGRNPADLIRRTQSRWRISSKPDDVS
jgi:phosphoribosylamine--glycine ligase